jgi:serine/threonine protein kinase/Tfp pilus assembly protein PilF
MPSIQLSAHSPPFSDDKSEQVDSKDHPKQFVVATDSGGDNKLDAANDPNATQRVFVNGPFLFTKVLHDRLEQDCKELFLRSGADSNENLQINFAIPAHDWSKSPGLSSNSDLGSLSESVPEGKLPQIPGYEVLAELGRGGMGVVYQARHCFLKRLVALKMILAGPHAGPAAKARFRTEAEAVARLHHTNIVQIYEVGECEGRPFLALEFVDGNSLLRKVCGKAQTENEIARLMETLAGAVHYSHERGIIHRDLKPNNILMASDGTPKITDFGLAKVLDADLSLSQTDTLIGTPSYMAPEQAAGKTERVGTSADVYSLGAIMYELLTGRAPFRGDSPLKTLEQVRNQEPVPPGRLRKSISRDLETICLKCLEKNPEKRYSSAYALAEDLNRFLDGRPIQARPMRSWQKCWRFIRRHPAIAAGVLAAVAIVCLLLTAWGYSQAVVQLAHHNAEKKYAQFVQCRNEALFYGLLASDDRELFLGSEPALNLKNGRSAASQALTLAGVETSSMKIMVDPNIPPARKEAMAADCYTLLLMLASTRDQQPDNGAHEPNREALRILDGARQLGYETCALHSRRADLLERLGELDQSKMERNLAAAHLPEGALDCFLAGEEQYRRGNYKYASTFFNRVLNLQPDHFWARFFLAVCHLKMQQWEAARTGLGACLSQQSDFVWAYLFRSLAQEKLQAISEAESDLQTALALNPNQDARYVLLLTRGIIRFNQGKMDPARGDFQLAAELKPKQYHAYVNLAHLYLAQGQFRLANDQANTAQELHSPVQAVAAYHVERGRTFLHLNKNEEAIQACKTALTLSSNLPLAHEVCACAQLALGHFEQAEKSFDSYLSEGGEQKSVIYRGRGLARMKLGKYPEAADDYAHVLVQEPDGDIFLHRGWAYFFSDAWKLALRDFSKAIEMMPEAGDAYIGRGLARVMLGNYQEAVSDAEIALSRQPSSPEMMHNVACIYAQAVIGVERDQRQQDRKPLSDDFRKRAISAILETLKMVDLEERWSFWHTKILPDMALAPVHNETEFKRLLEEYSRQRK